MGIGDWAKSPIPNPHFIFLNNYLKLCKIINSKNKN